MAPSPDLPVVRPRQDLAGLSIAVVAGLSLAVTALFLCAVPLAGHIAGSRDFVSYWATGQRLVRHQNPYDRDAIAALEHVAGLDARAVLVMRNPPWALPLAWPLGFLDLRVAVILWSLLLTACLVVSVFTVRHLHGSIYGSGCSSGPSPIHWLGMAFTPALICLTMGQTALFALLGLVLFLRYHSKRPWAAGAALWLCLLKPHLFLPFAAALCAWIVFARAWRVLAGALAALALSSAAAFLIAPHAWAGYFDLMRSPLVENEFVPCLADALRHWVWPEHPGTRYLPALLACAWALAYFWRRRSTWDWTRNSSILILVGLLAAPYCYLYDQCLAIPALMHGAYVTRARPLLTLLSFLILLALIELCFVPVISPLWLWTAPAWFVWYLCAHRLKASSQFV